MAYSFESSPNPAFDPFVLIAQTSASAGNPTTAQAASEATLITAHNGGDFSADYQLVGKLEDPLTVDTETGTIRTTDGSDILTSETLSLELSDLNFTKANYEAMRDATDGIHKQLCDVLLLDPSDTSNVIKISGMILNVAPMIGEDRKIKITGTRQSTDLDNILSIVTLTS